jgi:hypothetical protein
MRPSMLASSAMLTCDAKAKVLIGSRIRNTKNAMETHAMLSKVVLLVAALTITVPAFADSVVPPGPVKTPIVGQVGTPKKVVIKKPLPPCKPIPGHTACPR